MSQTSSSWTVLSGPFTDEKSRKYHVCQCACGKVSNVWIAGDKLSSSRCKRCSSRINNLKRSNGNPKHPTYKVWASIKQRCLNPKCKAFPNYGGRGITVCDEWLKFEPFRDWAVSSGYRKGLEIDRIDNDKGYCPENCHFITPTENAYNRRVTVRISAFSEIKTVKEWVADPRCVVSARLLRERMREGWLAEKALTTTST